MHTPKKSELPKAVAILIATALAAWAVIVLLTGCGEKKPPVPPPPPPTHVWTTGQIVADTGECLPHATVRIAGNLVILDDKAKFKHQTAYGPRRAIGVSCAEFVTYRATFPATSNINLGQLRLKSVAHEPEVPAWGTFLPRGAHDRQMTAYHTEKWQLMMDENRDYGMNFVLAGIDLNLAVIRNMHEEGEVCDFHPLIRNWEEWPHVNPALIAKLRLMAEYAAECGLWLLVEIANPNETKHEQWNWWWPTQHGDAVYSTEENDVANAWRVVTQDVCTTLGDFSNVAYITHNERGFTSASPTQEWVALICETVNAHAPDAPILAFTGDHDDTPETCEFIRSTTWIDGYGMHLVVNDPEEACVPEKLLIELESPLNCQSTDVSWHVNEAHSRGWGYGHFCCLWRAAYEYGGTTDRRYEERQRMFESLVWSE